MKYWYKGKYEKICIYLKIVKEENPFIYRYKLYITINSIVKYFEIVQ